MERKIILNLAMSIDGFIADEDGGYDWIEGDGRNALDTEQKWDYSKFLEDVDVVVMGRHCYDQKMHLDFKEKKVLVASSSLSGGDENVTIISGDICKAILSEREKEGKNIFLFGGGILLDDLMKADMIDEYIIGMIPIILGKGIPLFLHGNSAIKLRLNEYYVDSGILVLRYFKR